MACFPDVPAPKELSLYTIINCAILTVVGSVSNLVVMVTIIKDPLQKLHTPFNIFLLNVVFSDLVLNLVAMPIGIYMHYEEYMQTLGKEIVKARHLTVLISGTASILGLILLSLDRYVAIRYATRYKTYLTFRRCFIMSFGLWVISLSVPFLYFAWNFVGYLMFFAHASILLALMIMSIVHFRVASYLRQKRQDIIKRLSTTAPRQSIEVYEYRDLTLQRKITRTFMYMLGAFVAVYIPAVLMIYILHFCESCDCIFRHVLRDLSFLLICTNSCVNPFIYALRVKVFKKSLQAMFSFSRRLEIRMQKPRNSVDTLSTSL